MYHLLEGGNRYLVQLYSKRHAQHKYKFNLGVPTPSSADHVVLADEATGRACAPRLVAAQPANVAYRAGPDTDLKFSTLRD